MKNYLAPFLTFTIVFFAAVNTVFPKGMITTPTVPASNITFTNYTTTSVRVNWTSGDGQKRIVVVKQGSAVDWTPSDLTILSGVHGNFNTATNQGNGNKVVYNGASNSVNITGLTSGLTYHVAIYEYNGVNNGSPATVMYLITGAPVGSFSPLAPEISVSPSSLSGFSAVIGASSTEQTYTVSASDIYTNLTITPPADYEVSLTSGSGFSSSLSIPPVSYTVPATTIYVRLSPTGNPGSRTGSITNRSTGATTKTVSLSGTAYVGAPTVSASNIYFTNVSFSSMTVNWTNGNGTKRIVVVREGAAVNWTPTDLTKINGVNADFSLASDQGGGNKVVYNNSNNIVNVTGLSSGLTYHVTVYEYNGFNTTTPSTARYKITDAPVGNAATTNPSISVAPPNRLGLDALVGSSSIEKSYVVSATGLFDNLQISAPSQFEIATSSSGPYGSSLTLIPSSGTVSSTTIYVRMTPSIPGNHSGSISHSSMGADNKFVFVSGTATAPAYVWTGASDLDWQNSSNWSPNRIVVQSTDTLRFTSSPSGTIVNVPSESIPKLDIQNSSNVALEASAPGNTLTLNLASSSGNALSILSGSSLTLTGSNQMNISIASGSIADVAGDIAVSGADHTLGGLGLWNFGISSTVSYNGGVNQTVSNLNYANLVLDGNNMITLPSGVLSIKGNFTNNSTGTVDPNDGMVLFTGSPVFINGTAVTTFNNLSLGNNASVTLGNSQNLIGTLTLGTASNFTTTGYTFTLLSTESSTARIGVVPSNATITGNISVQRFIPASGGRYWYHLGSPVTGATFAQLKTNSTSLPPSPDYGIFITGNPIANTTPDIPGIGITNTQIASVYSYKTSSANWIKPADLLNVLPPKVGYRFFIRDGSEDIAPTTGAKILTLTGAPNTGEQSFNLSYSSASAGWNFIANPYPSDITADLSSVGWNTGSANLLNNTVYIWDADAGTYVSCLNGTPSASGACTISSFQGFWVATTAPGTLMVSESAKQVGSSTIFKMAATSTINVPVKLTNLSTNISHGTLIRMDESASREFDSELDALQLVDDGPGAVPAFISIASNKKYAINTLPLSDEETVTLNIVVPAGENQLDFSEMNVPEDLNVYLVDVFSNKVIDLKSESVYTFSAKEDTKEEERFRVVFKQMDNSSAVNNLSAGLVIYPNPTKGSVSVLLNNIVFETASIQVFDAVGRLVYSNSVTNENNELDLSKLASGIYTLVCITGSESFTEKLIIE